MQFIVITTVAAITVAAFTSEDRYWAAKQDGSHVQQTQAVTVDMLGNVYVAGYSLSPSLSAFDAAGTNASTIPISGGQGAYVIKYSSVGSFVWMVRLDGSFTDEAMGLSTDSMDNVYVCGRHFSSSIVYDPRGIAVKTLQSSGSDTAFVVKFASNGSLLWTARQDSTSDDTAQTVSTDSKDNVYVGGYYQGVVGVYNAQGVNVKTMTLNGGQASFLAKYASNGSYVWAIKLDGTSGYYIHGSSVDFQDNVLVTGYHLTAMNVYDATGSIAQTLSVSGVYSSFAVKFNSNGSFIWASRQGGSSFDYGIGISSSTSLVFVAGLYQSSPLVVYDSQDNNVKSLASSGSAASFVVAYQHNGSFAWAARQDGTSNEQPSGCAVDLQGNIVVTGDYQSSPLRIFDMFDSQVKSLPLSGARGGFTIKYFANGSLSWAARQDGAGDDYPTAIFLDSYGNVYSAGYHQSLQLRIFDALGTLKSQALTLSGTQSGYVVKYDENGMWNNTFNNGQSSSIAVQSTLFFSTPTTGQQSSSSQIVTSQSVSRVLSSSTMLTAMTSTLERQSSTIATQTTLDEQVGLYFSQPVHGLASSKSSTIDLTITLQFTPTIQINLMFILIAGIGLLLSLIILGFVCYMCRRKMYKARTQINNESQITTVVDQTTNMATTAMVTSHVLAVPQFLALKFGVDIRQLDQIARGGGGSINHCQVLDASKLQHYDNSMLVIKNLGRDAVQLAEILRRSFYQEISMLHMFRDQPYFAKMVGFTEQPATIVLKFYEMGSLLKYILAQSQQLTKFRYSKRQVLLLQLKIGQGLLFMHSKQFAHCDIKPDNVLLEQVGQHLEPRITDFGISRLLDRNASQVQAFQLSRIQGVSLRYAAPEVITRFRHQMAQNDPNIWKGGDVYSFAIVQYEILMRRGVWSLQGKL